MHISNHWKSRLPRSKIVLIQAWLMCMPANQAPDVNWNYLCAINCRILPSRSSIVIHQIPPGGAWKGVAIKVTFFLIFSYGAVALATQNITLTRYLSTFLVLSFILSRFPIKSSCCQTEIQYRHLTDNRVVLFPETTKHPYITEPVLRVRQCKYQRQYFYFKLHKMI